MQNLEIILKSGVVIKVKVDNWEITKNTRENVITQFKADSCSPLLPYINLSEVAAIVAR